MAEDAGKGNYGRVAAALAGVVVVCLGAMAAIAPGSSASIRSHAETSTTVWLCPSGSARRRQPSFCAGPRSTPPAAPAASTLRSGAGSWPSAGPVIG